MLYTVSASFTDPVLADDLETHFLEGLPSSWMLERKRPGEPYTLTGYFESEANGAAAWSELQELFPKLPGAAKGELDDHDWKEAYKHHFTAWTSRNLHWVPAWQRDEYAVPEGHQALYLDPGMAFGTGNHETTRLCAERLLDYVEVIGKEAFVEKLVMDAGCGSGILAISAVLLGAKNVAGFDRDPEAVRVSILNAAENNLEGQVDFYPGGLEDGLAGRSCDVLMANIQADVLVLYATEILSAVAPGGWLILSGILAEERARVADTFALQAEALWGVGEAETRVLGEWADCLLVRPEA